MDCKVSFESTRGKRICVDCTECEGPGSLNAAACMGNVMRILKKNPAEEIKFVKKDFSELYDKSETALFTEFTQVIKEMEDDRIWEGVSGVAEEQAQALRQFISEILSGFYDSPLKTYSMLEGVLHQYREGYVPPVKEEKQKKDKTGKSKKSKSKGKDKKKGKDAADIKNPSVTGEEMAAGGEVAPQPDPSEAFKGYVSILENICCKIRATGLIKAHVDGNLKELLKPVVQPALIPSHVELEVPKNSKLLSTYTVLGSDVRLYERQGENVYFVSPPELWLYPHQVKLLAKLNDYISKEHSLEIFDPRDARNYFRQVAMENLPKLCNGETKQELESLAEIFARYSAGYGLLEILFRDRMITDVYVDSPPGASPVYINHIKYGSCLTNVYLTQGDMERLSSKFRAISERPFDEANPILDMDLADVGIRVAGVRAPSTFDGLAYAFRKRREDPWTLPRFVQQGMMTARTAAILSFLMYGNSAMLVTGARGAGKTSLLSALIAEISQEDRIILMEDTAEIPSASLRKCGWKVEHMKNQSAIASRKSFELAPEDNLRAALRLGESVLVLGEVRGTEARVLFEAMRVGAAGNSVLGTIHGSTAYDTWDRVTNDLSVPASSFKAVDAIVCLRYRELVGTVGKSRRLMNVTEVRKKWSDNPEEEGAFFDIMQFNEHREEEEFNLDDSELIKTICRRKGLQLEEFAQLIVVRERIMQRIVEASLQYEEVLDLVHVARSNNRYRYLCGRVPLSEVYPQWEEWFIRYLEGLGESHAAEAGQVEEAVEATDMVDPESGEVAGEGDTGYVGNEPGVLPDVGETPEESPLLVASEAIDGMNPSMEEPRINAVD